MFCVPPRLKQLCFYILLSIKWRSLKLFASAVLVSTKVPLGNNENCYRLGTFVYVHGIFAVYVKSIFWEVSDKHVAGVSANKMFTLYALVCEYFTDLVSKPPAMQNCLHSEESFKRNITEKEKLNNRKIHWTTGMAKTPETWLIHKHSVFCSYCIFLGCMFFHGRESWLVVTKGKYRLIILLCFTFHSKACEKFI